MLKERIKSLINQEGYVSFDRFMQIALLDAKEGYYSIKDPIGEHGDFITSPEISQVFGELIGLFLLDVWLKMGSPKRVYLIELGAGRGTLLADILRATKSVADFHGALIIKIVEVNPILIEQQRKELEGYNNIFWKNRVEDINIDAPVLIYSNEFFDVLPNKQFVYKNKEWFELVVINKVEDFGLQFIKESNPMLSYIGKMFSLEDNKVYETSSVGNSIFHYLADMIKKYGGIILTIDYGYSVPTFKNSIRGYKKHRLLDIFEIINEVGKVDFTYNVNFFELIQIANGLSLDVYDIMEQKDFLEKLGIKERTEVLLKNISEDSIKKNFLSRINTLTSQEEMGERFKVMLVSKGVKNIDIFKKC